MKVYVLVVFFSISLPTYLYGQSRLPVYHTVKRGEGVGEIASRYRTTPKEILQLNRISRIPATDRLRPGTKLLIRYISWKKKENIILYTKKYIKKYKFTEGGYPNFLEGAIPNSIAKKFRISEESFQELLRDQNIALKGSEENINEKNINKAIEEKSVVTNLPAIAFNNNETQIFSSDVEGNIPITTQQNNNAIAVIIGNKNYQNQDVPEVSYAHRDANTIKNYLTHTLGYKEGNIIYAEDASQATFFSIFGNEANHKGKLYDYVKPNESDIFIYYNGHGGPSPETKEAYFVPSDCDPSQLSLNGYALNTFYKNLSQLPYKTITVVIDACFSGVSEGGALLKNLSPVFINTENQIKLDENAVVLTASTSNQVASWYPEKRHSLFSYFLMKGMQGEADLDGDKKIALKELGTYLLEEVPYWARRLHSREQNPEIWGNLTHTFSTY